MLFCAVLSHERRWSQAYGAILNLSTNSMQKHEIGAVNRGWTYSIALPSGLRVWCIFEVVPEVLSD